MESVRRKINASEFYNEYHGHREEHLKLLYPILREQNPDGGIIWTAGDSSLDNKYWFKDHRSAIGAYG